MRTQIYRNKLGIKTEPTSDGEVSGSDGYKIFHIIFFQKKNGTEIKIKDKPPVA